MSNTDALLAGLPEAQRNTARVALAIGDAIHGKDAATAGAALEIVIRATEHELQRKRPDLPNFREFMITALGGYIGIGENKRAGIA